MIATLLARLIGLLLLATIVVFAGLVVWLGRPVLPVYVPPVLKVPKSTPANPYIWHTNTTAPAERIAFWQSHIKVAYCEESKQYEVWILWNGVGWREEVLSDNRQEFYTNFPSLTAARNACHYEAMQQAEYEATDNDTPHTLTIELTTPCGLIIN